jgi:symplekin
MALMFRLIKRRIWSFPRLYEGFTKCLNVLGPSCVEIIIALPEDQIIKVLDGNEKIVRWCNSYITSQSSLKSRYTRILKNAMRMRK